MAKRIKGRAGRREGEVLNEIEAQPGAAADCACRHARRRQRRALGAAPRHSGAPSASIVSWNRRIRRPTFFVPTTYRRSRAFRARGEFAARGHARHDPRRIRVNAVAPGVIKTQVRT